jgi:hypothetical protein
LAGVPLGRGLQIYRENAKALAVRALGAAAPRLRAWLGDEFPGLAWAYARAHPPQRGDAAQWGHELPAFMDSLPGMEPEPVALARLDLALHRLAGAADEPAPDPTLWERLSSRPPSALRLRLSAHLAVVPLSALMRDAAWAAAQVDAPASEAPLPGEAWDGTVFVWRQGWLPAWGAASAESVAWLAALAQSPHLEAALLAQGAQHPDFDLGAWLVSAWQRGWLLDAV